MTMTVADGCHLCPSSLFHTLTRLSSEALQTYVFPAKQTSLITSACPWKLLTSCKAPQIHIRYNISKIEVPGK